MALKTKGENENKPSKLCLIPENVFGGSSVGSNPVSFLRRYVLKLTASLPIHRSSQRSALGAARSVKNYIWCTRKDTRVLLIEKNIFSVFISCCFLFHDVVFLQVRCGPGSFWAPPAKFKPTSIDDRTARCCSFCGCGRTELWAGLIACVCWFYLTSNWFPVRRHLDFG